MDIEFLLLGAIVPAVATAIAELLRRVRATERNAVQRDRDRKQVESRLAGLRLSPGERIVVVGDDQGRPIAES